MPCTNYFSLTGAASENQQWIAKTLWV